MWGIDLLNVNDWGAGPRNKKRVVWFKEYFSWLSVHHTNCRNKQVLSLRVKTDEVFPVQVTHGRWVFWLRWRGLTLTSNVYVVRFEPMTFCEEVKHLTTRPFGGGSSFNVERIYFYVDPRSCVFDTIFTHLYV